MIIASPPIPLDENVFVVLGTKGELTFTHGSQEVMVTPAALRNLMKLLEIVMNMHDLVVSAQPAKGDA